MLPNAVFLHFFTYKYLTIQKKIHEIREEEVSSLRSPHLRWSSPHLFYLLTPLFSPPFLRCCHPVCAVIPSALLLQTFVRPSDPPSVPPPVLVLCLQNFSRKQLSPQNQTVGRQISEPHIKLLMDPPHLSWGFVLRHAGRKQRCHRNRLDLSSLDSRCVRNSSISADQHTRNLPAATAPPRGHTGIADQR